MEYSNKQDKCRKKGISTEGGEIRQNDRQMLYKVPVVITIFFWIIKIMATTVGETGADYMIEKLNLGLTNTTIVMSILLIIILLIQFKARVYVPSIYWLTVVLISVVGTLVTDNLTDNLGVPLQMTTIFFTVALMVTFVAWYVSEKTLSIHSIYTIKREAFYWLSILFTFALGTAAGDLIAEGLDLGYLTSALIFGALIGLVTIAHYVFKMSAVLAFWIAYILTRPFGASLGDYLSQSQHAGGLGLGTSGTSVIFLLIIIILVFYLTKTRRDAPSLTVELGKS
ncbi:COG4705 family protein [Viridibacillus arvi]|uniref:COG4705 family protein n=1 Tax=Viridibacillus arvi TaxID=263475 RepID=UPI003D2CF442